MAGSLRYSDGFSQKEIVNEQPLCGCTTAKFHLYSFIHPFAHSFVRSFVYLFVDSFVLAFVLSLVD